MYNKLYGFYHNDTLLEYLNARFSELSAVTKNLEYITLDETSDKAQLWGVNVFPTIILTKHDLMGPILQGAYPGHTLLQWLQKYNVEVSKDN